MIKKINENEYVQSSKYYCDIHYLNFNPEAVMLVKYYEGWGSNPYTYIETYNGLYEMVDGIDEFEKRHPYGGWEAYPRGY